MGKRIVHCCNWLFCCKICFVGDALIYKHIPHNVRKDPQTQAGLHFTRMP